MGNFKEIENRLNHGKSIELEDLIVDLDMPWANKIDIYSSLTGLWGSTTLSEARFGMVSASVGTKILFAGGHTGSAASAKVDKIVPNDSIDHTDIVSNIIFCLIVNCV